MRKVTLTLCWIHDGSGYFSTTVVESEVESDDEGEEPPDVCDGAAPPDFGEGWSPPDFISWSGVVSVSGIYEVESSAGSARELELLRRMWILFCLDAL